MKISGYPIWSHSLGLVILFSVFFLDVDNLKADQYAFLSTEKAREYPIRGTAASIVLKQYGEPVDRKIPIGDPPITYWVYDKFTVYFEDKLVITTVTQEDQLPFSLEKIQ